MQNVAIQIQHELPTVITEIKIVGMIVIVVVAIK
jgi:hypothetical protein